MSQPDRPEAATTAREPFPWQHEDEDACPPNSSLCCCTRKWIAGQFSDAQERHDRTVLAMVESDAKLANALRDDLAAENQRAERAERDRDETQIAAEAYQQQAEFDRDALVKRVEDLERLTTLQIEKGLPKP